MFAHRSDRVKTYVKVIEKFIENSRKYVGKNGKMIVNLVLSC